MKSIGTGMRAITLGGVGLACIWAGITGRGEHMGPALARIDAASAAAARREARGLERQRQALERRRAAARLAAEVE